MIKNIKIYITFALAVLMATSCTKTLDVTPRTSLAADDALTTLLGVQAALNGTYAGLRGPAGYTATAGAATYYGREMTLNPELLADNVRNVNPGTCSCRGNTLLINAVSAHLNIWNPAYSVITKANVVLAAADKLNDGTTPAQKASIKAQALFVRALVYFDLIKTYAYNPNFIQNNFSLGVPLVLDAVDDYSKVTFPERAPVTAVYAQIEKDLLESISLFGTTGVNASTGTPYIATAGATHALLSRLYLYMGGTKNASAVTEATAALSSGIGTFQATPAAYLSMWAAASKPESMFELQFASTAELPQNPNDNTIQANYQQVLNGTTRVGFGDIVVSNNLLAEYETNDIRRSVMVNYTRADGEQVVQTNKFQGSKGSFGFDNVPIIRISEMYLNRAEASARSGNEAQAVSDLNVIRNRSGLPSISPAGTALIDAILKERRLELAFEGHRFFDLTRLGRDIPKATIATIPFSDFRILAPLPLTELDVNKSLVQNPRY
jgi:hypothetical protein